MTRRSLFAAGPLAFAACNRGKRAYLGRNDPPASQSLVFHIEAEPEVLDPAKSEGGSEEFILPSLFEGLLTLHPNTNDLLPALATHYGSNEDATEFLFYLRGHPQPSGIRVGTAPPRTSQASWSDGSPITAHDFVYSWRRAVAPATASPMASLLYCIRNAEEINGGKLAPEALGVSAIDAFTLRVELRSPTSYFPQLHDNFVYYVVPGRAIESALESWTQPDRMVTSGPYRLGRWKPGESISLEKNPRYYDAASVQLEHVVIRPVAGSSANINLYKSGACDWVPGKLLPAAVLPTLQRVQDFHVCPAYWCMFFAVNTRLPPFDNVLVRYALNMAIDKPAIARFAGAGRIAASSLIPELDDYRPISSLPVNAGGIEVDVLRYDPAAARGLLRKAGVDRLRIEIQYPNHPETAYLPLILQQQWRQAFGAEVHITPQEQKVWIRSRNELAYRGVSERGWIADYLDPNAFLEAFLSGPNVIGSGWSDNRFDGMLAEANASVPGARMRRLAECERYLLRHMPILPLYYNVFTHLRKPYVKGVEPRRLGLTRFKYVWIDRNWRAA